MGSEDDESSFPDAQRLNTLAASVNGLINREYNAFAAFHAFRTQYGPFRALFLKPVRKYQLGVADAYKLVLSDM